MLFFSIQTEKLMTNAFISIIDDISKYSVQVRATVSSMCRQMGFWSEWSQPIYVGKYLLFILKQLTFLMVKADDPGKCTHSLSNLNLLIFCQSTVFLTRDRFTIKSTKLTCSSILLA